MNRSDYSLPAWGAWIEIIFGVPKSFFLDSLPAWGAWIEIGSCWSAALADWFAPRMGSVD